jgi:predicted transcriptional regulator
MAQLLATARQTVRDRLQALADAGEAWPSPTLLEAIETKDGARAVLIDVAVDDAPVRVNISVGEQLLSRLDAAAEARGMSRSGFIAQAVRVSLGERPAGSADFDVASRRVQDELSALGRKINDSIGPDSAFSRRMAEVDDLFYDGVRRAADSVSAAVSRRRRTSQTDVPARDA